MLHIITQDRPDRDVNHSPLCMRIAAAVIYSLISSGVRTSQSLRIDFVAYAKASHPSLPPHGR